MYISYARASGDTVGAVSFPFLFPSQLSWSLFANRDVSPSFSLEKTKPQVLAYDRPFYQLNMTSVFAVERPNAL